MGYWYTHLLMIAGVVLVATGVKGGLAHPLDVDARAAWLVAAGIALYLLGCAAFRRSFRVGRVTPRVVVAALAALVGVAGALLPALATLAGGAALVGALLLVERASE